MVSRRSSPGPRRRYHHGDLRRALVDAALDLVDRGGPEALTLRAAARHAGVTHAAPYRHFADKTALLAAVAEEGFRSMGSELGTAVAGAGSNARARLGAVAHAYARFAVTQPSRFRVMFGPEVADKSAHPGLRRAVQDTLSELVATVVAGQEAGFVRGGDPEDIGLAVLSLLHGLTSVVLDGHLQGRGIGAEQLPGLVDRMSQILYAGIAPPGTGP